MNFPLQIFLNYINHDYRAAILKKSSFCLVPSYMAVAAYCYYEKVTMRTEIVLYHLNPIQDAHGWGRSQKGPTSLKSVTHILQ